MTRPPRITRTALASLSLLSLAVDARAAYADTVVQVPLGALLDRRSVTVLQGTTIVPFNLTIDGGGGDTGMGSLQNGFATQAVAKVKSPGNVANALPDDGHFPANARHPAEVVLHYSNDADVTAGQNHMVAPTGGTFSFPMPAATYSKVFLFFHGANRGTKVTLTLTYSDATTQVATATIPDFAGAPTDPMVFSLVSNLAKWSKTTTIAEAGGHNIFGAEVDPMAGKTLTMIQVERGTTGYLVFWGATGIATSAVTGLDAGTGGGTDGGADAATGAGGGGGTTATGGTSGTGAAGSAGGGAGVSGGGAGAVGSAGASGGGAGVVGGAGVSGGGAGSAGTSGSTGAAGSVAPHNGGGSGCRLAGDDGARQAHALWLVLGLAGAWCVGRRRRRDRVRSGDRRTA